MTKRSKQWKKIVDAAYNVDLALTIAEAPYQATDELDSKSMWINHVNLKSKDYARKLRSETLRRW